MTSERHIPSMTVAARTAAPVTQSDLEAMLASASFRAFADLLSAALIILDRSENIVLANLAAEKLSGMGRAEIEQRPFERFLRRSGLDIDDWLSKAVKGRSDARVRGAAGSLDLFATRRVIPHNAISVLVKDRSFPKLIMLENQILQCSTIVGTLAELQK